MILTAMEPGLPQWMEVWSLWSQGRKERVGKQGKGGRLKLAAYTVTEPTEQLRV